MKIWLDRRVCTLWDAACEADFADKYLGPEFEPTACTVMMVEEDNHDELIFHIKDRDGIEKELVVTDANLADAIDSWFKAYQAQKSEKAVDVTVDQVR